MDKSIKNIAPTIAHDLNRGLWKRTQNRTVLTVFLK